MAEEQKNRENEARIRIGRRARERYMWIIIVDTPMCRTGEHYYYNYY